MRVVGEARGVRLAAALPLVAVSLLAAGLTGVLPMTLAAGLAALTSAGFAVPVVRGGGQDPEGLADDGVVGRLHDGGEVQPGLHRPAGLGHVPEDEHRPG